MRVKYDILLIFLLLLLPMTAFAQTEQPARQSTSALHVPDNDVYLITPELFSILSRYRAGEAFEPLGEIEQALNKRAYLPSLHFWAGMRALALASAHRDTDAYDEAVQQHFNQCIERAERAATIDKFHVAGLFYEGLCHASLGMYQAMRDNVIQAGLSGRTAIKRFFEVLELRPDLHGALLMIGAYNYYTANLGTLGRILLGILGLPKGDRETGLKQMRQAAQTGSPVDVLGKMMLASALVHREKKPEEGLALMQEVVQLIPNSVEAYMQLADLALMSGRLEMADQAIQQAREHQPPKEVRNSLADFRQQDHRLALTEAMIGILVQHNPDGLHTLNRYRTELPKGAPPFLKLFSAVRLGHIYKLADEMTTANRLYRWAYDEDGPNSIRDQAQRYLDGEEDIRKRIQLDEETRDSLKQWLITQPSPFE